MSTFMCCFRYYACHLSPAVTDGETANVCWFHGCPWIEWQRVPAQQLNCIASAHSISACDAHVRECFRPCAGHVLTLEAATPCKLQPSGLCCSEALCKPVFWLKLQWQLSFQMLILSVVPCLWGKGIKCELFLIKFLHKKSLDNYLVFSTSKDFLYFWVMWCLELCLGFLFVCFLDCKNYQSIFF